MKRIFFMAMLLIGMVAGCGASESGTESKGKESVAQTEGYALTDKGVGPITLGMRTSDIPSAVAGLYDRVVKEETPDAEAYNFFLGDTALFSAEDYGDGIISGISLWNESPIKVATSSGENYISKE